MKSFFRRLWQWFKGFIFWRGERKKHLQLLESADQEISNMLAHVSQVEDENDRLIKALKERLKTDSESENYRAGLREGFARGKAEQLDKGFDAGFDRGYKVGTKVKEKQMPVDLSTPNVWVGKPIWTCLKCGAAEQTELSLRGEDKDK